MPVTEILTKLSFDEIRSKNSNFAVLFWAEWHELSRPGGPMCEIFQALSEKYPTIEFYRIEAEVVTDVSLEFSISVVPTFISCQGVKLIEKIEGANPADVSKLIKTLSHIPPTNIQAPTGGTSSSSDINARLKKLVNSAPVILFMKGSPAAPRCGFSRQIVEILQSNTIPFASFDILTDEDVRAGLKTYSEWPTYPQLYVAGEFMGGIDIVKEMVESGESLRDQLGIDKLQLPPPPPTLEERLTALINTAPVMLFMKGEPDAPRCGFSRTIVGILREQSVPFSHFDILTDEDVRAGLKSFSDWPTYPQLYANGSLVGGLDILKEMVESGPLAPQLGLN